MFRRAPALPLAVLLALAPAAIEAESDTDYDRARAAVARGETLPLATLLPRIEAEHGGRAIEVEMEEEDGRRIYEFEILTADGRLFEVDVDAATGQTLDVEEELD